MSAKKLDASYWNDRYTEGRTGWDIGEANRGLIDYVASRFDKSTRILIPGAGAGHEAEALWRAGYLHTYVLDWSDRAFTAMRQRLMHRPPLKLDHQTRLIVSDFFQHNGRYDLILEQTFMCAIDPGLRKSYVRHAAELLRPSGTWAGVLFDREFEGGPPFGGSREEYTELFSRHFAIEHLATYQHSIAPRAGHEVFGIMRVLPAGAVQ